MNSAARAVREVNERRAQPQGRNIEAVTDQTPSFRLADKQIDESADNDIQIDTTAKRNSWDAHDCVKEMPELCSSRTSDFIAWCFALQPYLECLDANHVEVEMQMWIVLSKIRSGEGCAISDDKMLELEHMMPSSSVTDMTDKIGTTSVMELLDYLGWSHFDVDVNVVVD